MSATTEEKTSKKVWLSYIPLVLLALTFILPLLFMLFSSLKPKDQILSDLTTSGRSCLSVTCRSTTMSACSTGCPSPGSS